jgi:putative sigma-54 modulation protein
MKITYTGKQEKLYPAQTKKLEVRFTKLAKVLDGKGEKSAHVILTNKRGVHNAEITVNYLDHALVGADVNADQFSAITAALDKLEKQILKVRDKRREGKKGPKVAWEDQEPATVTAKAAVNSRSAAANSKPAAPVQDAKQKVFRVNHKAANKPMTLDEAMLELGGDGDYVVYRDARKDCLSVLLRRPDGHFDLIES